MRVAATTRRGDNEIAAGSITKSAVSAVPRASIVVFAAAVPPMMMKTPGNPDGPLEPAEAALVAGDVVKQGDEVTIRAATA